ncbi:hypothetical protein BDV38DRAFT_280872 [Aspergillus pseudotamarii]|uniref:Xylanolytic transcriptional activator regulatory domain-containing protein n=1 Tax=Aspergillus pseudotamarii TaxID=132259 RepID=A0A5N6SZY6_ASPPS|nr:uncharacterized protein BDV38DRAFT_280872 [Aspergillus pseudotamarii]KAE8139517.1 hypothetical protein BDV38DRAFT_280872 [Aspergillus pseudotamarii]
MHVNLSRNSPGPSMDNMGSGARPRRPHSASFGLDSTTCFNWMHLLSDDGQRWIESRTGETVRFEELCALDLPWANTRRLYMETLNSGSIHELPSRCSVEGHVKQYFSSFQSLVFPVISKSLFEKTLDLAYGPRSSFGSASARSCVYAFLAVVNLFEIGDNLQEAMDCGYFASAAQTFMVQVTQEMTVDGLQAVIMLILFQYFLGDLQAAAVSVSIATRLLYTLGANTMSGVDSSGCSQPYDKNIEECHLRDLFWVCYSFDKDICLRTGQPPAINDSYCNLTLPSDYSRLQDSNILRDSMSMDTHTLPLFPWDLRLSKIKSEAYEALYSAGAQRKSDSEILSSIRNLDEALEQWRISLHPDFRPTLSFSPETPVSANLNTQAVMLRLAYYHCVTMIHQASERGRLSDDCTECRLSGINTSISLAINAGTSTLSYLQTVLPVVEGECFWVVLFYAITAILTLFRNILHNPLGPEAHHHVHILREVPDLIRRIPIRKLTLGEVIHLRFLDGFTTELARLGACAISQVQQEAAGMSGTKPLATDIEYPL